MKEIFIKRLPTYMQESLDYNVTSPITKDFFKTVQNKMYFAVCGNTAEEIIENWANHKKINMVLTNCLS